MLRIAREVKGTQGLIDGSLYEEMQYSYHCRLLNYVTLYPSGPKTKTISVYELMSIKVLCIHEWDVATGTTR